MATQNIGTVAVHSASGRWYARKRYTDKDGLKREWLRYFDSKKEADDELKRFNKSLLKGEVVKESKLTFGQACNDVLENIHKPKVKPTTYRVYKGFINIQLAKLKDVPIHKVTVEMLEDAINNAYAARFKRKMAPKSKQSLRTFVMGVYRHLLRLKLVSENVAASTYIPDRAAPRKIRALTKEQLQALLAASQGKWKVMYALQASTGLRIGEVLGLHHSDIKNGMATITRQIQRVNLDQPRTNAEGKQRVTALVEQTPKSQSSVRTVAIPEPVLRMIADLPVNGPYVFHTSTAQPYDLRRVQSQLDKDCKKAGLERFGTHVLRHTYATLQVSAGTHLVVIKDALGHTNIATTTIYAEASVETIKAANDKLGSLIFDDVRTNLANTEPVKLEERKEELAVSA